MKFFILILFVLVLFNLNGQTAGKLTVTATTVSYGGSYSPHNVVAIWVQSKTGTFVKTLLAYASARKAYLSNWSTATSSTYNVVDAITAATQTSQGVRTCSWNGANLTGTVLGDDTYNVIMEMTEGGNNKLATFAITKGKTMQSITPANVAGFSNISIKWTPATTALEDVEIAKFYQVYPNPAKNIIYINGSGINELQLYNLNGKCVFKTINTQINVGALNKGEYILKIVSNQGLFQKQIIKE